MSGPVDPPADGPRHEPDGIGTPPPPPPGGGYPNEQQGQQAYGQPQYGQPQYAQQQYGGAPPQGNGLAVAALVLGILGVILAFIPLLGVVAGVLFGLPAVICGGLGLSKAKQPGRGGKGMAIAGLVLGVIAIILGILQATLWGAAVNTVTDPGFQQEVEEQLEELEELVS